jgi:hypothetical protein
MDVKERRIASIIFYLIEYINILLTEKKLWYILDANRKMF